MEIEHVLRTARAAAAEAAAVHAAHRGRVGPSDWGEKRRADFVTFVDREAEQAVVARILAAHPGHAVLAEEGTEGTLDHRDALRGDGGAGDPRDAGGGPDRPETGAAPARPENGGGPDRPESGGAGASLAGSAADGWLWVIDPLDGTTNFLHGYPAYAASVAVLRGGEPVAGCVACSATGEEWWAAAGRGAFRNGAPLAVSIVDRLEHALIGTGFPFKTIHLLPRYLRQFGPVLARTSGVRRGGSAALDLCHLATGWLDGFWELDLAPWDVAAGTLVVQEAGGVVTRLDGVGDVLSGVRKRPRSAGVGDGTTSGGGAEGASVLGGNPAVHRLLGELLRAEEAPGADR